VITVLYVDDEPGLLEIGKIFLEQNGQFSVDTITSAPAALALMETKAYDAIISDYQMPDMDGIRFLKKVRSSGNTIPFILFTGRGREEIVIQALNEGADYYLQKGGDLLVQFTELTHQIRQAVQQRRAETSLRDHERREADIINFLPDATFAIDTKGTVIAWNHAMEEMTGVKPAEILGKNNYEYAVPFYHERRPILIDLVLAPDEKFEREKYLYTIRDRTMLTAETVLEKPDGSRIHLWAKACRLFDKNGNLAGAIESIRDITRNRQAEEALRESEARYQSILSASPDVIAISDVAGVVQMVSPSAMRMFGFEREDQILGHPITGFIAPEDRDRAAANIALMHQGIFTGPGEYRAIGAGGSTFNIEVNGEFIRDAHRQPTGMVFVVRDITGRKRAEDALRESEVKYRLLADTSPEMIYLVTPEGCIQYVNSTAARGFKTTPEDLVGKRITDLFPPDVAKHHLEAIRKVISTRQPCVNEIADVLPSGKICIEVRLSPVLDRENKVIGVLGLSIDITQRKSAEDALRESEVRFRTIFENQQNGLIMVDAETHMIVDANRTALSLFGATRDDVIGRVCHTFICPAEEGNCPVTDLGHSVDMAERVLLNIRGERVPVIKSVSRTILGDHTYLIESFTDITDRKRMEEALRASEEKYHGIFENTSVAVFQTRMDGSPATVNPAFARLMRYETPEMVIREVPDIRAIYGDPAQRDKLYQTLMTNGAVEDYEIALRRRDGSTLWASVNVRAVYGNDGKIIGLEGLVVDVTDRKKTEEALLEVNKKLNLLSRITRHDINNQLLLLQANLGLLKKKQLDPSFNTLFQKIANAAQGISSMVRFTREYEEIGINTPVWQDCHALADTAAQDVPPGMILLQNDLPSGTEVFADPLIVKVFYNLIDNAIRYGRTITTIRFSLEESGEDHLILCEDDGDGVPAEVKERIFERDFGRNTGLGLFLSREVLAITGITIRENGEPGKGARFEILVPKGAYRSARTGKE
jgi:PAS domain S-box-containing protein